MSLISDFEEIALNLGDVGIMCLHRRRTSEAEESSSSRGNRNNVSSGISVGGLSIAKEEFCRFDITPKLWEMRDAVVAIPFGWNVEYPYILLGKDS